MKAIINSCGRLIISPETELEMYALKKWGAENTNNGPVQLVNMEIDMSNDPMFKKLDGILIDSLTEKK